MVDRPRIPVAVLGATGAVGQRFVQLLAAHSWFDLVAVMASERSVGKPYREGCHWVIPGDPPPATADLVIRPLLPDVPARLVFSALPSSVARDVEPLFAHAGYAVCSNVSTYRAVWDVPLLIPDINADHVRLIETQRRQRGWPGLLVTSPNCTISGVAMALKALDEAFGVRKVFMTSMQAVSGAGYPGVPSMDILGNVIPYIEGEEDKFEREARKLLGTYRDGKIEDAPLVLSAHANRVPVLDGHTISLSVGFERKPDPPAATQVLQAYRGYASERKLPSAPQHPVIVRSEPDRPQPRRDIDVEAGMTVTVGRLRACPLLDLRMTVVVHNTLRGAASGAVLNAELLVAEGYVA